MKNHIFLFLGCLIFTISCKKIRKEKTNVKVEYSKLTTLEYELFRPNTPPKSVLILFGGYPETAIDIQREFKILEVAKESEVAILYANLNQKLWLEDKEKVQLAEVLHTAILNNKLPTDNIYVGGFSSGGHVALLISSYITETKKYNLKPKGVFIVDSPIDLSALFTTAETNLKVNFSKDAVLESTWLIKSLEERFGNPNTNITNYQNFSIYTNSTKYFKNISSLKNTKIRFYTEPDVLWWKENRKTDLKQTNAYYIKQLSDKLKKSEFKFVEYIATENRGYRTNGDRHPHSWSIVDPVGLINWMIQ